MPSRITRLSRRSLLTDFGVAGVGLIVLGACGGSSDSGDAPSSSASTDVEPTGPASTEVVAVGETSPDTAPGASATLQLQHVSLGPVSAYVLVRGNEVAIVDTGQSGSRQAIFDGLDEMSVAPSAVRHVVLTHNHGDHVGGLSDMETDLSNATVYAGAADIVSIQSSLTLTELNDGDEVFGMGVIGTPGHTPGSISRFDTGSGILVAGDAINGDGNGGLTGANPAFSSDLDAAAASVAKLAALAPATAAFGHGGPPVTDDVAAKLSALG